MARRILRIALLTAAAVTTLVVLVVAGFTIVGIPVPATITAEGIPKVSVWRLPTVARALMGGPVPSLLAGVDSAGRLVVDRGFDVVAVADDGTLTPATDMPRASYFDLEGARCPDGPVPFSSVACATRRRSRTSC